MKKRKIRIIIILLILLLTLLLAFVLFFKSIKSQVIASTSSNTFSIFGYLVDINNSPINSAQITVSNNSGTSYTSITSIDGYYQIKEIPQGEYSISCNYNDIEISDISATAFASTYQENLEMAFLYPSSQQYSDTILENFQNQLNILTKSQQKRFFNIPFSNEYNASENEQLKTKILGLEKDMSSESAFWHTNESSWKTIYTLFSNDYTTIDQLDSYLTNNMISNMNDDYIRLLQNPVNPYSTFSTNFADLLNIQYTILNKNSLNYVTSKDPVSKKETIKYIQNFSLDTNSMVNFKLNASTANLQATYNSKGCIIGQLKTEDSIPVNNCTIKLYKLNTSNSQASIVSYAYPNEFGNYSFSNISQGYYIIRYSFTQEDSDDSYGFNGQNYNIYNTFTPISSSSSNNLQNNAIYISRASVIGPNEDLSNTNIINNTLENYIDSSVTKEGRYLDAVTNQFYYKESQIISNVILKKREQFTLELKNNLSAYRIVLSNGQVYSQNQNIDFKDINCILENIDNSQRYGAKAYIEYTITAYNRSNIDCTGLSILLGSNALFDKVPDLLSSNEQSSGKWFTLNSSGNTPYNAYFILKDYSRNNTPVIKANSSIDYKILLSVNIAECCSISTIAEIYDYRNNGLPYTYNEFSTMRTENEGARRNYSYSNDHLSGKKNISGNYFLRKRPRNA